MRVCAGFLCLPIAAALTAGCGPSKSLAGILGPTVNVSVTALAINVSPPAVGRTVIATATATFDDGTTSLVSANYSSSNIAVASVAPVTGVVTGTAIGDVTIAADFRGFHAARTVRVLPSYDGTFAGTYRIDSCVDEGDVRDVGHFCQFVVPGSSYQIAFEFTQTSNLKSVTALFALANILAPTLGGGGSGTVSDAGELTFAGSATLTTTTMTFRNFVATSPSAGHISGRFEQVWTDTTVSGQAVVTCTLQDATSAVSSASYQLPVTSY